MKGIYKSYESDPQWYKRYIKQLLYSKTLIIIIDKSYFNSKYCLNELNALLYLLQSERENPKRKVIIAKFNYLMKIIQK